MKTFYTYNKIIVTAALLLLISIAFAHAKGSEIYSNKPDNYELSQNYPNPFNPTTIITYSIPEENFVTLKIYNMLGNEIVTLVKEDQKAGKYSIKFSAKGGSAFGGDAYDLASGVYFYRIHAGDFVQTKKLTVLK